MNNHSASDTVPKAPTLAEQDRQLRSWLWEKTPVFVRRRYYSSSISNCLLCFSRGVIRPKRHKGGHAG